MTPVEVSFFVGITFSPQFSRQDRNEACDVVLQEFFPNGDVVTASLNDHAESNKELVTQARNINI